MGRRHRPRRLPLLSTHEVIKVLQKVCYCFSNRRGSELVLIPTCASMEGRAYLPIIVPERKEILRSTLETILDRAYISREEFFNLLYN